MSMGLGQVVVGHMQVVGGQDQERVVGDHEHIVDGGQEVNMVVGMLGQDAQPIGQQILAFAPIPKAARRARNRQTQIAELLTSSPYKNALIEKVALRGRDGEGVTMRSKKESKRERRSKREGKRYDDSQRTTIRRRKGKAAKKIGGRGRDNGMCITRGGIPTPARWVRNTWWSQVRSECCRC